MICALSREREVAADCLQGLVELLSRPARRAGELAERIAEDEVFKRLIDFETRERLRRSIGYAADILILLRHIMQIVCADSTDSVRDLIVSLARAGHLRVYADVREDRMCVEIRALERTLCVSPQEAAALSSTHRAASLVHYLLRCKHVDEVLETVMRSAHGYRGALTSALERLRAEIEYVQSKCVDSECRRALTSALNEITVILSYL